MDNKNTIIGIGIDVSKAKLDISLMKAEGENIHFTVENNENGIKKIIKRVKGYKKKMVMESTGRYHLLSALMLSEAGFDVRVVNPIVSSKYMKAGIRKNKTDKIDAHGLAEMSVIGRDLPKPFKTNPLSVHIRQKIGLIASMETQVQTLKAIYNNYKEFQGKIKIELSQAEDEIIDAIESLSDAKNKLEKEIEILISEQNKDNSKHQVLISVPGISPYVASLILQFFNEDYNKSAKQWIAYAGMDISVKESGTWKGRGRTSKRGNAYLRKRLFSAAWGATMHNDEFKKYYNELKEKGRRHVEALMIIARKLIRIAFVLLNKNQFFNNELCFII